MRDFPHFRIHACRRHKHHRTPVGNRRTAVDHIQAVAQGQFFCIKRSVGFVDVFRFTRQSGFVYLQRIILQNATIGGGNIPCLQQQDIPRHEGKRGNFKLFSVTQHARMGCGHRFQAFQRFLCLKMLHRSKNRIQNQHRNNNNRAFPAARQRGNDCRNQQNYHQ